MSLLAITRAAGMISAYGQDGYSQILAKLAEFGRSAGGLSVAVLDDAASMHNFGGPAAGADAASLQVTAARAASLVDSLTGVLIIGGDNVIPFYPIPNPVKDSAIDPDPVVYTDNPYGLDRAFDLQASLNPTFAVGRICAGAGEPASALCAVLDNAIGNRSRRTVRAGYVEVTNRVWENVSTSVVSALAGAGRTLVCPNDRVTAANANVLDCKYLYCNLHGFLNDSAWRGEDPVRGYVTALDPNSFQSDYVSGTFVYSDACYGLQTAGRRTTGSCALTLMARGAAAVVGSTGLAFGTAPGGPLDVIDADALTRAFFTQVKIGGTIGDCLKRARSAFAPGRLDAYQKKTLLQFQLLGDPTLAVN
jgi:hypothetical protein